MKRIWALPALMLYGLTACNSMPGEKKYNAAGIGQKDAAASEETDPVCGMIKDSTWTDYAVYKGDTVWFCAATEKNAFIANPKKYIK